eukprot:440707_1
MSMFATMPVMDSVGIAFANDPVPIERGGADFGGNQRVEEELPPTKLGTVTSVLGRNPTGQMTSTDTLAPITGVEGEHTVPRLPQPGRQEPPPPDREGYTIT